MPDWSGIGAGVASGAVAGGTAGAAFGPWGIPIGAALGAFGTGLSNGLSNRDKNRNSQAANTSNNGGQGGYNQLQNYTPQQQDIFNKTGQMGLQNMQNPYQGWEPLKQQATDYWNQELSPEITNNFTSGSGGARLSSPAFASQLAAGGTGLAAMLNEQKMRYGQQNRDFGLQQAKFGSQQQFENIYEPGQVGFGEQIGDLLGKAGISSIDDIKDLMNKGKEYFNKKNDPDGKKASLKEMWSQLSPNQQKQFINQIQQKRATSQFNTAVQNQLPVNAAKQSNRISVNPLASKPGDNNQYRNVGSEFNTATKNFFPAGTSTAGNVKGNFGTPMQQLQQQSRSSLPPTFQGLKNKSYLPVGFR